MKLTSTAALRHRVLEAWAEETAGDIAEREGITRNVVLGIVRRARQAGDARAIAKPDAPRKPGWWAAGCPKTAVIAAMGGRAGRANAKRRSKKLVIGWSGGTGTAEVTDPALIRFFQRGA